MFDRSTPESTLVIVNAIALTLTQAIKSLTGLTDQYAQDLAFLIGGLLGAIALICIYQRFFGQ